MLHDLHYFYFDMSSQNSELSSEAISIDELGLIAQNFHISATFFLLMFIFHKKLVLEVRYRFFFCLVYIIFNYIDIFCFIVHTVHNLGFLMKNNLL